MTTISIPPNRLVRVSFDVVENRLEVHDAESGESLGAAQPRIVIDELGNSSLTFAEPKP